MVFSIAPFFDSPLAFQGLFSFHGVFDPPSFEPRSWLFSRSLASWAFMVFPARRGGGGLFRYIGPPAFRGFSESWQVSGFFGAADHEARRWPFMVFLKSPFAASCRDLLVSLFQKVGKIFVNFEPCPGLSVPGLYIRRVLIINNYKSYYIFWKKHCKTRLFGKILKTFITSRGPGAGDGLVNIIYLIVS